MCNFILTYDFCGVKTVRNNDIPSEYRPTYIPFEGELSKLLARFFIVDLCLGIRFGMRVQCRPMSCNIDTSEYTVYYCAI